MHRLDGMRQIGFAAHRSFYTVRVMPPGWNVLHEPTACLVMMGLLVIVIDSDHTASSTRRIYPIASAGIPLLSAAFIADHLRRLISLVIASTFALLAAGMAGAWLGGAGLLKPTGRVLVGG